MGEQRRIVHRNEGLARTLTALDLGEVAHTTDELVGAGGSVPGLPGLPAHEPRGEDVGSTPKESPKQSDLLFGVRRYRPRQGRRDGHAHSGFGGLLQSQLGAKRGETRPNPGLLSFEAGEKSLGLGYLPDELFLATHGLAFSGKLRHPRGAPPQAVAGTPAPWGASAPILLNDSRANRSSSRIASGATWDSRITGGRGLIQ